MNDQLLLSIAIPTYNRLKYLKDNLTILLEQISPYKKDIEIIVSDNHSDINPLDEIEKLERIYDFKIIKWRNDENINAEANISLLAGKTKGKYTYFLGDDDLLSPNFLDIIIPILKSESYGIIHFGRLVGDTDCSNSRLYDPVYEGMKFSLSFETFMHRLVSSPNFISSMIFDKRCWNLGKEYAKDNYYGYQWFASVINGAKILNKPCFYYYMPLVIMRNPARVWSKLNTLYFIVGMSNIFKDLDESVSGIYDEWIKRMHDSRFYNLPGELIKTQNDRVFYREKRKELYLYLSDQERRFLNYWLYTPVPKTSTFVYYNYKKIANPIKRKIYSIWTLIKK